MQRRDEEIKVRSAAKGVINQRESKCGQREYFMMASVLYELCECRGRTFMQAGQRERRCRQKFVSDKLRGKQTWRTYNKTALHDEG